MCAHSFLGESMDPESTMAYAYYREGAASPTFLFCKYALDGVKCGGKHLTVGRGSNIGTASRDSISTSANTRRPLTFGRQVLTGSSISPSSCQVTYLSTNSCPSTQLYN